MKEVVVEEAHVRRVKRQKGRSLKFVSPGLKGVTDRIDFYPIPPEHREIVAKYIHLTELKRPGEKPREDQKREHARMRRLGFHVQVIDNVEGNPL